MNTDARVVGKEPETECRKGVQLPAFEDKTLSAEGQQHLVELLNDPERETHVGKDLPALAKEDLLARLR